MILTGGNEMLGTDSDKNWETFGATDPYFGVLTDEKYRGSGLTDERRTEFFKSGHDYIHNILKNVKHRIDPMFSPRKAIDFGCGVGRLVIPLAGIAEQVVGLDVSPSMLNEARKNCDARAINNVVLYQSDDDLTSLSGKYNFIHSYIVFQHIPVRRGEHIFNRLIEHLEDEGVGVVHFTYSKRDRASAVISWARKYIPLVHNFINLMRGRNLFSPHMQMNSYNLNRLLLILKKHNVHDFYADFVDHGALLGVMLYFKKQGDAR